MRIAIVVNTFPTVSETFILDHIIGLIDRGHDVQIIARVLGHPEVVHDAVHEYDLLNKAYFAYRPKASRVTQAPIAIVRGLAKNASAVRKALDPFTVGRAAFGLHPLYWAMPAILEGPFDIVHCHFGTNGQWGILLKRLGLTRCVVTTFHGHDLRLGFSQGGNIYGDLPREGDAVLALSNYGCDALAGFGFPQETIVRLPMGVDTHRFVPSLDTQPKTNGVSETLQIVTVGRLVREKGFVHGIKAIAQLVEARPDLRVRYTIVGPGRLRTELNELVNQLGLGRVVRLIGAAKASQVPTIMQNADIFMLPSIEEGFSIAAAEAQATGLPVVATDVGGVAENVIDNVTGLLVRPGQPQELAAALLTLVDDAELRLRMGKAARSRAVQRFDSNVLNDRLVELYDHLLRGGVPADFVSGE